MIVNVENESSRGIVGVFDFGPQDTAIINVGDYTLTIGKNSLLVIHNDTDEASELEFKSLVGIKPADATEELTDAARELWSDMEGIFNVLFNKRGSRR